MIKRLLILDADTAISNMLQIMFDREGIHVRSVSQSESPHLEVNNFKPHLIVIDISDKRTKGRKFCRLLKTSARTHTIPIVALSKFSALSETDEVLHADHIILKPLQFPELENVIKRKIEAL